MNPPSREIRVLFVPSRLGEGGIVDFPTDTLDTLENSSLPQVPCTSAPRFTLGTHAHKERVRSRSLMADFILSKSRALNTHSPAPYNQQRLIPSRLFAYVSHDEQGMKRSGGFRR